MRAGTRSDCLCPSGPVTEQTLLLPRNVPKPCIEPALSIPALDIFYDLTLLVRGHPFRYLFRPQGNCSDRFSAAGAAT